MPAAAMKELIAALVSIDDTLKLLLKLQCAEREMTVEHLRAFNPELEEGEVELDTTPAGRLAALLQEEHRRAVAGEPPLSPEDESEITGDT